MTDSSSGRRIPRAVPGHPVRRPRAAVPDGAQAGQRAVEELARAAPPRIRDQADAARITVASRVVEEVLRVAHTASPFGGREEALPPFDLS